jgi:hypothetical protein
MKIIPLSECKHGFTYHIHSRNLGIGVFNQETSGFVGIRRKFDDEFLFQEFHWDIGPPFGTVYPKEEIEKCPVEDLREYTGSVCGICGKEISRREGVDHSRPMPVEKRWRHKEPTDCENTTPCAKINKALFDYLKKLEEQNVS